MAFNTTSYLAGVGSVVVVLSTGFAGGYFFASPDQHAPPNRLQRVAADTKDAKAADAKATPTETPSLQPALAAAVAAPTQVEAAQASTTQPASAQSSAPAAPVPAAPTQAAAAQSAAPPTPAPQLAERIPEPAHATHEQTAAQATPEKTNADKLGSEKEKADKEYARIAEAKAAGKKRAEARKLAEEQRRQHELEVAAAAVRHIIHDRDGDEIVVRDAPRPDVVEVDQAEPPPGPDMRPFNFFGR